MKKMVLTVLVSLPCLLAQNGVQCENVGGAIVTNFLDQTTTLGVATGGLACGFRRRRTLIPKGSRTAFRADPEHHRSVATLAF